jgi:hypothetical protein
MMKSTSACCTREGAVASCTPSPVWLPKRLTEYADCLSAIVCFVVVLFGRGRSSERMRAVRGPGATRKLRSRVRVEWSKRLLSRCQD